jgi:O-antigen/teichoic acid export membrane protein
MQNIWTPRTLPLGNIGQSSERADTAACAKLTLRANFLWTLAGNVVYAASQWGIVIVLAKLGSPETVGKFALALAMSAPIYMFSNLQLRGVQATDAVGEYRFGDYLGLRLITTVGALLAILALTLVCGYRRETAFVILLVGLAKAFESISDVFYGLQQQHERMDRIAVSMMVKGLLSVAVFCLVFYLTGSLLWSVVSLATVWAVVLAIYDVRSGASTLGVVRDVQAVGIDQQRESQATLRSKLRFSTFVRLSWLALPLGIVMLLLSLNTNIPRYFIEHYLSERDLGIFAAMAYLLVAGTTVVSALGQSASPRLAQYYVAGNYKEFRSLLLKLLNVGGVIGGFGILVVLVAGPQILTLVYRREYADHTDVFLMLMVAAGIGYIASFLGYGMTAARYFKIQAPIFFAVCLTTTISCLLFIPEKRLVGAALAIVISTSLQMIISLLVVRHSIHRKSEEGTV